MKFREGEVMPLAAEGQWTAPADRLREAAEYALDYLVASNQRFNVDPTAIDKLERALAPIDAPWAAAPSLHKEELQAKFTRALANNNILEQMILANWKAGSEPAANPANSINLNGLINDLVDLLGAALHKEGAGGALTGNQLKEIALRHSTIVAGFEFAERFDFDAIAAELNAAASPAGRAEPPADLARRITDYLSSGGLVNPEMALHERVRDLLIECRAALAATDAPKGTGK